MEKKAHIQLSPEERAWPEDLAARRSAPLSIGAIERVVNLTLHDKLPGGAGLSLRKIAKEVGLSRSSVQRVWAAYGLKPHPTDISNVSCDSKFFERVQDIVGLYLNSPNNTLVLSVDAKSRTGAPDRTQSGSPLTQVRAGAMTDDCKRHGTTILIAALAAGAGNVIGERVDRHRRQELLRFLRNIDGATPKDLDLHLIVANYTAYQDAKVRTWLKGHARFHLNFTPTSASWIILVEWFFKRVSDEAVRRGVLHNSGEIQDAIDGYLENYNTEPKPFIWTAAAADILKKLARRRPAFDSLH